MINTVINTKEAIIERINSIIVKNGNFNVCDVEADNSPYIETKSHLSHLVEDFNEGYCVVYVYNPSSYTSDEIDVYEEFYEELCITQLEYILELANKWVEINLV
jgi:hypothetical protein